MKLGRTEPRVFTKPLRELTPETSRGFEVIAFAKNVLGVKLYPWQEWLLIHMLELLEDGTLRFRKALVIVGRQNGKTLMGAILAAFWLYVDSARWPQFLREADFVIVGGAQKLDIAMKPWKQVRAWGGPDDPKLGVAQERVPMLQTNTFPPRYTSGEIELRTHGGAVYMPRTFEGARGQSAARLLLDELREQYDYEGWSAIEKSANAMYDSLLLAFSNAGTARSVVLRDVLDIATEGVDEPATEWFLAEWSAHPDAKLTEAEAFAQANPSAGYQPGMTIAGLMRTAAKAKNKTVEQIEVLGQWVTAVAEPFMDEDSWNAVADGPHVDEYGVLEGTGSQIADDSDLCFAVDTSGNRRRSYVGVAGWRDDGKAHVELVAQRAGMLWVVDYLKRVRDATGCNRVAVQSRGCPAAEFVEPLKFAGFDVVEIQGTILLNSAGRFNDRVRDALVHHRDQPALNMSVLHGTSKDLSGMPVWDRFKSPVDVAPAAVVTNALYGLETGADVPVVKSAYSVVEGQAVKDWW